MVTVAMKLDPIALNLVRCVGIVLIMEKINGDLVEKQVECQEANEYSI